jgi:FtsZ-binding cell division protein ZapB
MPDSHDQEHETLRNGYSLLTQLVGMFEANIEAKLGPVMDALELMKKEVEALRAKNTTLGEELLKKATKDELSTATTAAKQAADAAKIAREEAQKAQTTANDGVNRANGAQNTANQALSRRLHMKTESVVYRSNASFDVQFTEGSRILGVWWSSQDESHVLAQFSIGTPQINGRQASVTVTGKGPGHLTRILWCILYEG